MDKKLRSQLRIPYPRIPAKTAVQKFWRAMRRISYPIQYVLARMDSYVAKWGGVRVKATAGVSPSSEFYPMAEAEYARFFLAHMWRFYEIRRAKTDDDILRWISLADKLVGEKPRRSWVQEAIETALYMAYGEDNLN